MNCLPRSLIALLLLSPLLVTCEQHDNNSLLHLQPPLISPVNQTTPLIEIQFHHIHVHLVPSTNPVCCLRPLPKPPESERQQQKDEPLFMSFEEWKEKQLLLQGDVEAKPAGFHYTSFDTNPQYLDNTSDSAKQKLTPQEILPPS